MKMMKKISSEKMWKTAAAAAAGMVLAFSIAGCGGDSSSQKAASSAAAGGRTKIVVGTAGTLAKWAQTAQNGSGVEGFDIDVVNEVARRNNWEVEWKTAEFQALWGMLDNKQIDTIAFEVTTNPQRLEKYKFTKPHAWESYSFVSRPDYDGSKGLESFKGKNIAVEAATNARLTLEKVNEEKNLGITMGYLDSQGALLPAVVNKQYDAAFMITSAAMIGINDLKYDLKLWDSQYKELPICYPFLKTPEGDKLREQFDKTLAEMQKDGTTVKFSEKWFGGDVTKEPAANKGK